MNDFVLNDGFERVIRIRRRPLREDHDILWLEGAADDPRGRGAGTWIVFGNEDDMDARGRIESGPRQRLSELHEVDPPDPLRRARQETGIVDGQDHFRAGGASRERSRKHEHAEDAPPGVRKRRRSIH